MGDDDAQGLRPHDESVAAEERNAESYFQLSALMHFRTCYSSPIYTPRPDLIRVPLTSHKLINTAHEKDRLSPLPFLASPAHV